VRASLRSRWSAGLLATALVLGVAACGDSQRDTFLGDGARALVGDLARAGIAVYAEPGDAQPLTEVAEPESPVRLLAWQVHTFERDASNRAGVISAELDALAATEPGEPTASEMVLAWALGTDTPAAAIARDQLSGFMELPEQRLWEFDAEQMLALDAELNAEPRDDPVPPVLPELALVLFLSDLATAGRLAGELNDEADATGSTGDDGASGDADLARPARAEPGPVGNPRWSHALGLGERATAASLLGAPAPELAARPCSLVLDFVNTMIADVFAAIPRLAEVTELRITFLGIELPKIITDIPRGLANGAVWVWNGAVEGLRVVVNGAVLTVTQALLEPIARVAAIVGTLAQIATIVRPWGFSMVGDPPSNRKAVTPESPIPGEVRARIELGGLDEWPPAIADCASRAGTPLPPLRPVGEDIEWLLLETPGGLLAQIDDPTGMVLDTDAAATVGYATGTEDPETAEGQVVTGYLIAGASVQRHDTTRILDVVNQALRAEFGRIVDLLAPIVRPKAQEWLDLLAAQLDGYAGVAGSVAVPILYHVPDDEPPPRPRPRPRPPVPPRPGPTPRPNGCGPGCGASLGDPHLITIDGAEYEFQGAGEFVLIRSDTVEVQVRYEPFGTQPAVSVHTAVAAAVDGHRVVLDERGLSIDGEPADRASGRRDLGQGAVAWNPFGGLTVDFPDGTTLNVIGSNIWIHASTELQASAVGLLGVGAGGAGLPPLPDGTTLGAPATPQETYEQRYDVFGPAWLVGETTLFHYGPGDSTATYYLPDFPDADHVLMELGDLAAVLRMVAEATCAGVSDTALFERCVFDVAVTGDDSFVATYEATETVMAAGGPAGTTTTTSAEPARPTTPPAAGQGGEPALVLSGEIVQYRAQLTGAIDTEAGTVLLARGGECTADVGFRVTVQSRTDDTAGGSMIVCDPEPVHARLADEDDEVVDREAYLWLPTGGVYDVEVSVWSMSTLDDPVSASVELFVDPTPTVVEIDGNDLSSFSGDYRLNGVGDTVAFMVTHPDAMVGFPSVTGFDVACGVEAWGGPSAVGDGGPWPLHFCAHADEVRLGYLWGLVVPVIVFNRTGDAIDISLGQPDG